MSLRDACLPIGSALTLLLLSALSVRAQPPSLTSTDQVERTAVVRDVRVEDSTVSGVIMNNSPRQLRDVRLIVRHSWHWKNERHPGDDNPSRAEDVTVPGEAAPRGSLPFTYRLNQPLPRRNDGHFVTSAEVISFSEVGY